MYYVRQCCKKGTYRILGGTDKVFQKQSLCISGILKFRNTLIGYLREHRANHSPTSAKYHFTLKFVRLRPKVVIILATAAQARPEIGPGPSKRFHTGK